MMFYYSTELGVDLGSGTAYYDASRTSGNTDWNGANLSVNLLGTFNLKGGTVKLYRDDGGNYINGNNTQNIYYKIYQGSVPAANTFSTFQLLAGGSGGTASFIGGNDYEASNYTGNVNLISPITSSGSWNMAVYFDGNASWGSQNYFDIAQDDRSGAYYIANISAFYGATGGGTQGSAFTGSGKFVKSGNNTTYTLNANNTYTGNTEIDQGTVEIASTGNLSSSSSIFIGSGANADNAQLTLSGSTASFGNNITINTSTGSGTRTLAQTGSTAQTLSGSFTMDRDVTINVTGSGLTITGVMSGGSTFTKTGTGALTLSGSSANTFSAGTVTVSAGTLILNKSANTSAIAGRPVDIASNATLRTDAAGQIGSAPLVTVTGTFDLNGNSQTVALGGGGSVKLDGSAASGTLTISNSGTDTFSGTISDNARTDGAVTKAGTGLQILSGNNSYDGLTTVSAGRLQVAHANALGTISGSTTVSAGAALELAGGITFGAESLTLNGTGVSDGGSLRNVSGNNTWQGAVTLGSGSRVQSSGGSLTISGAVAGGAHSLYLGGASGLTISGNLSGTKTSGDGAVLIDNTGTTTFSGSDNSGLTGNVQFSGSSGTILLGSANALGSGTLTFNYAASSSPTIASTSSAGRSLANSTTFIYNNALNLGVASTGTGSLTFGAVNLGNDATGSNQRTITTAAGSSHTFGAVAGGANNTLIKAGTGTLILSGASTTSGGVQLNDGTLLVGNASALGSGTLQVQFSVGGTKTLASSSSSAYTLANNINVYNDLTIGQTAGGTGSLTLGGTFYLGDEVNQNRILTVNGSHTLSGAVTGARGIVKQGSGTLILSGANTSTGNIYIDDGIINLSGGSLGAGNIEIGAGTGGASAATLRVTSGSFSRGIIVNTDTGAGTRTIDFANTSGTATLSGTVALEKTAEVSVASGGTGALSGVISGAGGLTKSGSGNLTVSGNNTFDGNVTINGGKVTMSNGNALGDTGTISVSAGADLEVTGGITVARNLTLSAKNGEIRGGRLMSSGASKNTYSGTVAVNNSEFDVASGSTLDVTGKISGTGTVTKTGAGELQLSNTGNDYSGITDVQNGTLTASTIANSSTASTIGSGSELKVGSASTAGTFKYTGSTASMNRTVTVGAAGGTINVNDSAATMTLTGTVAGSGATLTKTGAGKLALGSGSSTTVGTIAVQDGTLLLGAANTIDNSTAITMSGGTLAMGGYNDTVGRLSVSANSVFDFGNAGSATSAFTFSDFDTATYGGVAGLTFQNVNIGSTIVFNTNYDGNGTFNTFTSKISFAGGGLMNQISFSGGTTTLTVAAIPEPRVYAAAAGLVLLIGWAEFKRRRGKKLGASR